MGSSADLRICLTLSCFLSSHDMATLVMRSKDERTRNAALLRYTCGHGGRYFGLFHLIVMDHHIVINSKLVFRKVVYHLEVRCADAERICSGKSNVVRYGMDYTSESSKFRKILNFMLLYLCLKAHQQLKVIWRQGLA